MQYVLDDNEYLIFKNAQECRAINKIRTRALLSARNEILDSANFICIHDPGKISTGYCDDCPCSPIADGHDHNIWQLICGREQRYSK